MIPTFYILYMYYQYYLFQLLPGYIKYFYFLDTQFIIKTLRLDSLSLIRFFLSDWEQKYKNCLDITVIDKPGKILRFTIMYQLFSLTHNSRIMVVIQTNELLPILSISQLYKSAQWSEREVWDLFGVFVEHNNDLRRILTDYGFLGHPLRKDFPMSGFTEYTYNDYLKIIEKTPVELKQAYRVFSFPQRWAFNFVVNEEVETETIDTFNEAK
jgi:NADH:ubiquinone oxidoreductase subunit C